MFSGIVKAVGIVEELKSTSGILNIKISCNAGLREINIGDSVAVNGCCQTVVKKDRDSFIVQATQETLEKTNLKFLTVGSKVNLEPSLKLSESLDGHLVSGHVDFTGEICEILNDGENRIVAISFPKDYQKYIASKGSITVNGVSLTVIEVKDVRGGSASALTITLIPYTRDNTNLGLIKIGDPVNLEVDLVSRYVVNYLENARCNVGV